MWGDGWGEGVKGEWVRCWWREERNGEEKNDDEQREG